MAAYFILTPLYNYNSAYTFLYLHIKICIAYYRLFIAKEVYNGK